MTLTDEQVLEVVMLLDAIVTVISSKAPVGRQPSLSDAEIRDLVGDRSDAEIGRLVHDLISRADHPDDAIERGSIRLNRLRRGRRIRGAGHLRLIPEGN